MKIAIGSDHAGFEMKTRIINHFSEYEFTDLGCFSTESVDYPDYSKKVCEKVNSKECDFGILICGTGIGMAIAANKIKGIRASCCVNEMMAEYSRLHNNANVITLGARVVGDGLAYRLIDIFIKTSFEGSRHQKRIDKFE